MRVGAIINIAVVAIVISTSLVSPAQPKETKMFKCALQKIEVENSSSFWIKIIAIRWLDEPSAKWKLQPINDHYIQQNRTSALNVEPWGLSSATTFLQVKYQFLRDEDQMRWSETKTTSEVRIADCGIENLVPIKVVDFR